MKKIIISVDGPAGSGKGEISKHIAKKWNMHHLNSGLLYRRVAYLILKNRVNIEKKIEIKNLLKKIKTISFRENKKLKNDKISSISSKIAVLDFVRSYINKGKFRSSAEPWERRSAAASLAARRQRRSAAASLACRQLIEVRRPSLATK